MNRKEELLKAKIKSLQSTLGWTNRVVDELRDQVQGKPRPHPYDTIDGGRFLQFLDIHARRMRLYDLEIENIELKEQLAEVAAKKSREPGSRVHG